MALVPYQARLQMDESRKEKIREEARRAKTTALEKYNAGDLAGAKEFAVKAQNLDPALPGLLCLNSVLDVLIGSQKKKPDGEVDWHAVLAVDPTADIATMEASYSRLSLNIILNNHSSVPVGIAEPKKILKDAWNFLRNEKRRRLCDSLRRDQTASSSSSDVAGSFWTTCYSCSLHFEYPHSCKDQRVFCVQCSNIFEAIECPVPSIVRVNPWSYEKQQQLRRESLFPSLMASQLDQPKMMISERSEDRFEYLLPPSRVSPPVNRLSRAPGGKSKRKGPLSMNVVHVNQLSRTRSAGRKRKQLMLLPGMIKRAMVEKAKSMIKLRLETYASASQSHNVGSSSATNVPQDSKKPNVGSSSATNVPQDSKNPNVGSSSATNVPQDSKKSNVGSSSAANVPQDSKKPNVATRVKCESKDNAAKRVKCENKNTNDVVVKEEEEEKPYLKVMNVPDPDFYNFDGDRTESSFGENQVWAAYDDYDGMPRLYALVHSVVSREPFKLCISWLNSTNNEELGPMKWIDSGFYKTSGCFSVGRLVNNESLNSFSHRVQWTKGENMFVQIYPKKGDVWALYENFSPSWGFETPEKVVYKYEMVEVIQDFDEERGVAVAPLAKVPGFKTVFRRLPDPKTFPREELFRFSHQVPSRLLTGQEYSQEGENAPEGCLELDPAALSMELLNVFAKEETKNSENVFKKPKEEVVETMNNAQVHKIKEEKKD